MQFGVKGRQTSARVYVVSRSLTTYLQYNASYQGIDAGRENLRRALEAPEHYAALAEYGEKIEHDLYDA